MANGREGRTREEQKGKGGGRDKNQKWRGIVFF